MAGAGYVISGDLLAPLYSASLEISLVKVIQQKKDETKS